MQSVVDVGSDQTATAVVSTSNLSVTAVTAAAPTAGRSQPQLRYLLERGTAAAAPSVPQVVSAVNDGCGAGGVVVDTATVMAAETLPPGAAAPAIMGPEPDKPGTTSRGWVPGS